MLFAQTSAPTGWTKSTAHDNKALRVVSGAAGSGGSTAFTSVFASRTPSGTIASTTSTGTVGSTTLAESQIPSHAHQAWGNATNVTFFPLASGFSDGGSSFGTNPNTAKSGYILSTGGGGSHNHGLSMSAHNHGFTGVAMDFAVQYVDVILAAKN
jgi:hypothetical protein